MRRTTRTSRRDERGSVMVMVGLWLPLIALFVMFAIDVSHWFDYSRNLQLRADAAALAAGEQFGGICASASPTTAAMKPIGEMAQLYSGPGATSDLYYPYNTPLTDIPGSTYQNFPNLKKGPLDRYHVLLNSTSYWQPGQTSAAQSFSMGTVGDFCNVTDETGSSGPLADVRVTQDNLGLFFSFVKNVTPTINAHARVELQQGVSAANIRPIAVRDPAATPCLSVQFRNATTNAAIGAPVALKPNAGIVDSNNPGATVWDNTTNAGGGDTVAIPSGANVYAQPFLNNCSGSGDTYDDSTNSGLMYINSYPSTTPTLASGDAPVIANGGVTLGGSCTPDQYFATAACIDTVTAHVAFAPDAGTSAPIALTGPCGATSCPAASANGTWTYNGAGGLSLAAASGQNSIDISTTQTGGSVPSVKKGCTAAKPCTVDLGTQQQAFGACNGCTQPDDSGPIIAARLRLPADGAGASGRNAFPGGAATPKLVVEVEVQGLTFDKAGQKATVLRPGVSTDHATGLVNCGQGGGASADANAIEFGCPTVNSAACKDSTFCAPLTIYDASLHPGGICNPELRATSNPTYTDCVETTSGNRRNQIPGAVANIIVNGNTCSPNNWPAYSADPTGHPIQTDTDPRALLMIITAPADLSSNSTIPIRNFATFYITGWDSGGSIPNCNLPAPTGNPPVGTGNEAFPGPGSQNGTIWGHWIFYTSPNVTGNGKFCKPTQFGICAVTLSR